MDKVFVFNKERSIGEVISAGFQFYKMQFKPFMKYVLLYGGIPMVLLTLFYFLFFDQLFTSGLSDNPYAYRNPVDTVLTWAYFGNIFFSIIAGASIPTAIFTFISLFVKSDDGQVDKTDFRKLFFRKFFPVMGAIVLIWIAISLGFMVFLIPGIYLFTVFSTVLVIIIHEDMGIGSAISRSFEVIRGNWWPTFFLGLITLLMVVVIAYAVALLLIGGVGFVAGTTGFIDDPTYVTVFASVTGVLTMVIYGFASFLIFIFVALQYFSLVEKTDAPSLNQRIESITSELENRD